MNLAGIYGDAGRFRESNTAFERASALMTNLGYDQTQRAVKLFNDWALILTFAGRQLQAERYTGARSTQAGAVPPKVLCRRFSCTTMPACCGTSVASAKRRSMSI